MKPTIINDLFDRISKVLKNDQQYPYQRVGKLIVDSTSRVRNIESYYSSYPPLIDIIELGAALEYEGSSYQDEIIRQIKYKLQELKAILPDVA
jgi:hypothetical protein